ncbi:MAG: uroporphyrinogen decarboxylase [Alphaproteobacteria bacterium]|nr:uroporphyrinogen decarboxylase [Alphaproteobacteria bacterium]
MNLIINTLQGNVNLYPPIWLMRQAGRYLPEYRAIRETVPSFMELCFHEELATKITLQPIERFNFDAAILFSDILVIPHVLGQRVNIVEKKGPILEPIDASTFFENAQDVDLLKALSTPLNILRNVRKSLPSTKAVIGFSGSPWTIATYMLEGGKSATFDRIKNHLYTQSPLFIQTMALLEESIGTFLLAQIEAGADAVQIFDSWAKAVPLENQDEWIVDPIRRIISRIRGLYPNLPIIYYGRGVSPIYSKIVKDFPYLALGVDEGVPVSVMKNQIQKIAPVQGNLSPGILVEGGKKVRDSVRELLDAFQGTSFVFNLGHGILPQTPVDHVRELVELVRGREL